ncbi:hypothetical protein CGZ98_07690 [Enemella evansiae]|uniref:FtsK/SpoIIIE domain-containing protein n=1 Tax=Enemella evansiae TaxID=2016499 RepID=UPI000B96F34E|nr:FtsK/SpoIIIE domain-containing protein [Enemella evansiae]OYO12063.1 hypothetical protein CGZ98_07690 [Enemella evansiae]
MFNIKQNHTLELRSTRLQTLDDFERVSDRLRSALGARRLVITEPDPRCIQIRVIYEEALMNGYGEDRFFEAIARRHDFTNLPFAIDELGREVCVNFTEAPHLLGAGTSGSGKSVGAQALLASIVTAEGPKTLYLVDPKRVELSMWAPLAVSHATTADGMAETVEAVRAEMARRYEMMDGHGVRKLTEDPALYEELGGTCVLVVDELAEVLAAGGKNVGQALSSIAQLGRAANVLLLCFTQRPSADLFGKSTGTETLRSNLSNLIAWRVLRRPDVDVILGAGAASDDGKDSSSISSSMPGAAYSSFSDVMIRTPFITDERLLSFITKEKGSAIQRKPTV